MSLTFTCDRMHTHETGSAFDLLHYKDVDIKRLESIVPGLSSFTPRILERLDIAGRYKQHIIRQAHDIELFQRDESLAIDPDLDYSLLPGMSFEVRQRLSEARPTTLGHAKRLEGVTPTSLTSLMKHVRNRAARKSQALAQVERETEMRMGT